MTRKLTCIVAMDAAGYCRQMELDEAGTLSRLKDMRARIIDPAVARRSGRIVKVMGDGALMDFASVVDAVECAIEIQNQLARAEEDPALKLRIGIHLGDVFVDVEDIYGDGVNVASRLEAIAAPGGIVISRQVYDLIEGKISARLEPLGEQNVKNISRPIDAFAVSLGEARDGETGDGETRDGETGGGEAGAVIRFGGFELDTALYELRSGGAPAPVEPQVFDLILFLARNADRTVTKDEIFSAIWGDRIVSDSALSSQIKAARRALGDDGARQKMIATVHGRGFRFVAEIESKASPIVAAAEAAPEPERAVFASRPSVAILPFVNMNRDPDEDYFADGISEDITTALSRNRWLTVIARNPAFSFRGAEERGRAIGEKLGADYIVTGSVRKAGTRARVTAQLIDAENEHSIWSERFDRDMVDIFDLQDEISEMVRRGSNPNSDSASRRRPSAVPARTAAPGISISSAVRTSTSSRPRTTCALRSYCARRSRSTRPWRRRIRVSPTRSCSAWSISTCRPTPR